VSVIVALLAIEFVPARAHATVVVPLTRAELVQRADLIVRASVLSQRFGWNQAHTQIVTLTTLHVTQYLKGQGSSDLVLRQFGGQVDGMVSRVAGDAQLQPGQEVVVFLRASNEGVVFLTALAQSSYLVVHSPNTAPVVQRDLTDLTFAAHSGPNGVLVLSAPPVEPAETLTHLLADITSLVRGAR
jgi:hypothetical protein